jgi:zinc/manganese transport system ATP-binding protein
VHHLSGVFAEGSLTAITGANGAGKSSLLKAIAGVLQPFEGSIEFNGLRQREIAYLPQAADLPRDFPINVLQMVVSGYFQKTGAFGKISKEQQKAANGLADFAERTLDSLSAGQFQRSLFARLLVQDAKLILLDEPFTAVDEKTSKKLMSIIQEWHRQKRTVICVLHDFEQIRSFFPDCLLLARKLVAWGSSRDVLKPENLLPASFFKEATSHTHEVCEL